MIMMMMMIIIIIINLECFPIRVIAGGDKQIVGLVLAVAATNALQWDGADDESDNDHDGGHDGGHYGGHDVVHDYYIIINMVWSLQLLQHCITIRWF